MESPGSMSSVNCIESRSTFATESSMIALLESMTALTAGSSLGRRVGPQPDRCASNGAADASVIEAVRVMASERMNLTVVFTIGWRLTQGQTLEGIRALKACPERSEGRQLGE